jgi:hypothetical protein
LIEYGERLRPSTVTEEVRAHMTVAKMKISILPNP